MNIAQDTISCTYNIALPSGHQGPRSGVARLPRRRLLRPGREILHQAHRERGLIITTFLTAQVPVYFHALVMFYVFVSVDFRLGVVNL